MARERGAWFVVGATGHGKSTYLAKRANSLNANALVYKRGVHLPDKAFPLPVIRSLSEYRGGKVIVHGDYVPYMDLLHAIQDSHREGSKNPYKGSVVIDDARTYERDRPSVEMEDLLTNKRHYTIDIFYVYHGLSILPIEAIANLTGIMLFHTADNASYKARKLPCWDDLQAAKMAVSREVAAGNKYASRYIKLV